jgi:hypothetical protein
LQPGFYRAAQVSLIVSMLRTLNVELDPPELPVPRTVTLCPRCLAKASAGKPSAARFAMIAMVWPLTSTHFPSCSSTHPVNDAICPAGSAFCLGSAAGCACERFIARFDRAEESALLVNPTRTIISALRIITSSVRLALGVPNHTDGHESPITCGCPLGYSRWPFDYTHCEPANVRNLSVQICTTLRQRLPHRPWLSWRGAGTLAPFAGAAHFWQHACGAEFLRACRDSSCVAQACQLHFARRPHYRSAGRSICNRRWPLRAISGPIGTHRNYVEWRSWP